ncbi:hypothetical protein CQ10_19580 [Bradyrhizobium valentinum]|nr:hypothetical protein CQ10_19580 [Bradyrhizobium valentinum]
MAYTAFVAKAPHPALCADLSPQARGEVTFGALRAPEKVDGPRRGVRESTTTDCVACPANQARLGPVLVAKIFPFAITPNHPYNSAIPHPLEGRIAIVTDVGCGMRWTRQRRARRWLQGGLRPVSDRAARRRPALKRLGQNFGRQHMGMSKRMAGGSRGRQRRVVLAPVAGVKLMEICRAQPGFG